MKKTICAVLTATIILSGCKYNPYHDGQEFRVYNDIYGYMEPESHSMAIPVEGGSPYVLLLYGGHGKHHSVEISDSDILGYSYEKGSVRNVPFDYPEIETASVTLLPERLGLTSLRVTEEDTGESAVIDVKVCESYHALEVGGGQSPFADDTFFALRYGGKDNVLRICRGGIHTMDYKHIADGTYRFVDYDGQLSLEITYPADEEGHPDSEGEDRFRKYLVQDYYGGTYGDISEMMKYLNLTRLSVATRASFDNPDMQYRYDFRLVDITDGTIPEIPDYGYSDPYPDYGQSEEDSPSEDDGSAEDEKKVEYFYMLSAAVIPWVPD